MSSNPPGSSGTPSEGQQHLSASLGASLGPGSQPISAPSTPRGQRGAFLPNVGPSGSHLGRPSSPSVGSALGLGVPPGSPATTTGNSLGPGNAVPRRARSIHINIKPDPTPPSSILPSWLSGSTSSHQGASSANPLSSSTSSLHGSTSGSVPHRDFGMLPHPRQAANEATSSSPFNPGNSPRPHRRASSYSGPSGNSRTRWAGLIRNQIHRIERDGLKRTFWGPTRQFGNTTSARSSDSPLLSTSRRSAARTGGFFSVTWDRIRRIPDLLFVETVEDPVSNTNLWGYITNSNNAGDTSDDTADLLDDDEGGPTSGGAASKPSKPSKKRAVGRATNMTPYGGHLRTIRRRINSLRRRLGISRASFLLLLFLLVLGLLEIVRSQGGSRTGRGAYRVPSASRRGDTSNLQPIKIYPRDPFRSLALVGILPPAPRRSATAATRVTDAADIANPKQPKQDSPSNAAHLPTIQQPKTTAILLNWNRMDNLIVILAHLCMHTGTGGIFDSVIIWNNAPNVILSQKMFEASQCPKGRLKIYNSPGNLLFLARFLACSQADTPYCYFQDDDWLVPSLPAAHAHFMRNPEGPPVVTTGHDDETGDYFPAKSGYEWCFFNTDFDLNTCFAWLGTGAFVSRARVMQTLELVTSTQYGSVLPGGSQIELPLGPLQADETSMLDNYFTTLQNEPPYVLEGMLVRLPQKKGFTSGSGVGGDLRNEVYIVQLMLYNQQQKGIDRLSNSLQITTNVSPYPPPILPWSVDSSIYTNTIDPKSPDLLQPQRVHPHRHHTRSVSNTNSYLFITNVQNLPAPDSIMFQPHPQRNLTMWTESLAGPQAAELWKNGKEWVATWPYLNAVDGNWRTAWRSPDVIRSGDYIGLDLLAQLDTEAVPSVTLHFAIEDSEILSPLLKLETSIDGYNWQESNRPQAASCHSTGHLSTQPQNPPFPITYLTSPKARTAIEHAAAISQTKSFLSFSSGNVISRDRIENCQVIVKSTDGVGQRRKGWRFVRLRVEAEDSEIVNRDEMGIGWGVYEIWVV